MSKNIFGIDPQARTTIVSSKRNSGFTAEGVDFDQLNQLLFELRADHIIGNATQLSNNDCTCVFQSSDQTFRDSQGAVVTFLDGEKIIWAGLDTITASIDIGTIDDLTHETLTGVTIALGSYDLDLGENQRGELNLSGTGTLTVLSSNGLRVVTSGVTVDIQDGDFILNNTLSIPENKVTKTDTNYTILLSDRGDIIELGSATANRTFTLPSVGAGEDGFQVSVSNNSIYSLTLSVSDTDHIWNSGAGYGVELPKKGMIKLRYDHSKTKWDIVGKAGGKVLIEGLALYEPMNKMGVYQAGASVSGSQPDLTGKHTFKSYGNTVIALPSVSKFPPASLQFDGTGDYLDYEDSTDWDIFGTQTGHKTVSFWAYNDALGVTDYYISHFEDGNNEWNIYVNGSNEIVLQYTTGGVSQILISGGSVSAATWFHVAIVINGTESGVYINGVQVAYDATFTVGTIAGTLDIAQRGNNANNLAGRMQDLHISYNNPYGATPNSTPDDTFTVPATPFQGVMQ
jgi:hypothetical protein